MNTRLLQYLRIAISLLAIVLTSLACLGAEIQVSYASVTPAPITTSAAPTPATIAAAPIAISATELYQEREANATRFDQNFKGKRVLITGIIDSIDGGEVRLRVDSSFLGDVSLHDLPVAVQIRANKGEEFSAVCTVDNYIIAAMNLRDCQKQRPADGSQTAVTTDPTFTPMPTSNLTPKLATRTLTAATQTSIESPVPVAEDTEPAKMPQPALKPEPTQIQSSADPTLKAAPTPVEAPVSGLVELPSFGPGMQLVGDDIQQGLYRAEVANSLFPLCTWSRLSGLDGGLDSIIAIKIINKGFTYVRIKETDLAFESSGCTDFTLHQPGTSPAVQFGSGTYLVGTDIHPGLYKSQVGGGLIPFCSWSRLRDVDGSFGSVIATDIVISGQTLAEIDATDFAFETSGCQTWVIQGEPATALSQSPTPLPAMPSPTATLSSTNTPTTTATHSPTPVPIATETPTPALTSIPTGTPTPEATPTVTQTPTSSPSPTPGPTDTPTPTATPSPTPEPPSTPAELVERVQHSVVRVIARSNSGSLFGRTILGSGFIFAVEGTTAFIATNHHVIDGKSSVKVQIGDSSTYDALVLGWEAVRDVAVLSICCSSEFIALPWDQASPSEGESVIAIGYSGGITGNLITTIGEVRARDDLSVEHNFIPHSAPLNPGNSGGPLFSMPGAKVIGINTARGTETLAFYTVPYQAIEGQIDDWRSQLIVAPTATPTPVLTSGSVKVGGAVYTVHSIIDPAMPRNDRSAGERAVAVDVSIEAVQDGIDYDYDDFSVQDYEGYIHESDWLNRGVEPGLGRGTLAAGQRVRGWVNFNVGELAVLIAIQAETERGSPRVVIAGLTCE